MRSGQLKLYKLGGVEVESHLIYADDLTLFGRASSKSFHKMKSIIEETCSFTGLRMNKQKSLVVMLVSMENAQELAAIAKIQSNPCLFSTWEFQFLVKRSPWNCRKLIRAFKGTLNRWRNKGLSSEGRVQFVQWLFAGQFNHIIHSIILPKKTIKKIRSISYQFVWGTQREIYWTDKTFPRIEGRLNLRDYK